MMSEWRLSRWTLNGRRRVRWARKPRGVRVPHVAGYTTVPSLASDCSAWARHLRPLRMHSRQPNGLFARLIEDSKGVAGHLQARRTRIRRSAPLTCGFSHLTSTVGARRSQRRCVPGLGDAMGTAGLLRLVVPLRELSASTRHSSVSTYPTPGQWTTTTPPAWLAPSTQV